MAAAFYLVINCSNCDEGIYYGPCGTTLEHRGLPAIPFDMAAQTTFRCDRCEAENFTGDFEVDVEGGIDPADLGDDEGDEEPAGVTS